MKRWIALGMLMVVFAGCIDRRQSDTPSLAVTKAVAASQPSALDLLQAGIGDRRFVLLGEMHGTREIPALIGDLVERYAHAGKTTILALEIIEHDQASVDRYLASPGSEEDRAALLAGEHWRDPMHDGRDSQAMLQLIEHVRWLRAQGNEISIFLFDGGDGTQRNEGMADRLRAVSNASPKATVLVLTGNVHAMIRAPTWEMYDNGKQIEPPMTAGRYLADLDPLSIDIRASHGEIWTCMAGECGIHAMPRLDQQVSPHYESSDPLQSAWDATLSLPAFTASPPAVAASAPHAR